MTSDEGLTRLADYLRLPAGELLVAPVCELCGSVGGRPVVSEPFAGCEFTAVCCVGCGLCYTTPRPTLRFAQMLRTRSVRNDLVDAGFLAADRRTDQENVFDYCQQLRCDSNYRRGLALLRARQPAGGVLLDVGCAGGRFVELAAGEGYQALGSDLSPSAWADTPTAGLDLRVAPPNGLPPGLPELDAVALWNVLEHTEHPVALLSAVRQALRPGGLVLIEAPNMALRLAMSRIRGCTRSSDHRYMLYEHIFHYTPRTLGALLRRCGLRVATSSVANDDASGPARGGHRDRLLRALFTTTAGRLNWHHRLLCLAESV